MISALVSQGRMQARYQDVIEALQPVGFIGFSGESSVDPASVTVFSTDINPEHVPMATGCSCRSQVKLMADRAVRHPLQILNDLVRAGREAVP